MFEALSPETSGQGFCIFSSFPNSKPPATVSEQSIDRREARTAFSNVIPAKAGICPGRMFGCIPAYAAMTYLEK
jgi:hypothetical protein